jgi:hypothetical protein
MAGHSAATTINRRVEIMARDVTARVRDRGTTLVGYSFLRLGPEWLVATDVTRWRAPFT